MNTDGFAPLSALPQASCDALRPVRRACVLQVSHSPDPDDALAWWAWRTGRVSVPGIELECQPMGVEEANQACRRGGLDMAAISSAAYPHIARDYVILASGASVGRGYGPALVTRDLEHPAQLAGRTVAIPGELTTGALLARLFVPRANFVAMPFREVAPAVASGRVEGGVLIHEELLNWSSRGVRLLCCLGQEWTLRTGLPVPVGLVVARRSLERKLLRTVTRALRESIRIGMECRDEAASWAMRFSCETKAGIGDRFMDMFTNQDSLLLASECRVALQVLWTRGVKGGFLPGPAPIAEIIDDQTEEIAENRRHEDAA